MVLPEKEEILRKAGRVSEHTIEKHKEEAKWWKDTGTGGGTRLRATTRKPA